MSKVKFNPNDPKQVGSLGLHIMGINDMPADKWLSYFTSDEMKSYAMNDEQGFIGRLHPHLQDKATELLTQGYYINVPPEGTNNNFQSSVANHTTMKPTKASMRSVGKETVVTDKGIFTSIESLKVKLSGVYSIQDFDKVWVEALTLAKIDADVEYISNTSKKVLLSSIKSAILSAVEDTVNNI